MTKMTTVGLRINRNDSRPGHTRLVVEMKGPTTVTALWSVSQLLLDLGEKDEIGDDITLDMLDNLIRFRSLAELRCFGMGLQFTGEVT